VCARVGTGVGAEHREGKTRSAGDDAIRKTGMRVFVKVERTRPIVFHGVTKSVQGTHSWIPSPRENQLTRTSSADELIANEIWRQSHEREVTPSLADYFVAGSEGDEVRESFERDKVAIMDVRRDGGLQ
jgi:hypothetical protein